MSAVGRRTLNVRTDISRRPTNLPPEGCPPLCPRRSHHHRLLGRVSVFAGWGVDVVSSAESEEASVYFPAGVCAVGESRVSFRIFTLGMQADI